MEFLDKQDIIVPVLVSLMIGVVVYANRKLWSNLITKGQSYISGSSRKINVSYDLAYSLLKFILYEVLKKAIASGYASLEDKEAVSELFQSYKKEGGNSYVETLYKDFMNLPNKIRKRRVKSE